MMTIAARLPKKYARHDKRFQRAVLHQELQARRSQYLARLLDPDPAISLGADVFRAEAYGFLRAAHTFQVIDRRECDQLQAEIGAWV